MAVRFAAHTGTGPLEASRGRSFVIGCPGPGDRELNYAFYMMTMAQVRRPGAGLINYRRTLAEGKSPRRRCATGPKATERVPTGTYG